MIMPPHIFKEVDLTQFIFYLFYLLEIVNILIVSVNSSLGSQKKQRKLAKVILILTKIQRDKQNFFIMVCLFIVFVVI